MKVLVLSWRGPGHPLSGGAEQSTWKHIEGWVKRGVDVTLFTSSFPGCVGQEEKQGVKIIRRGDQYFGVKLFAFIHCISNKYDLVIDEFHGIPFYTPLFCKKSICFIHEVAGPVWKLNQWPKPFNLLPLLLGPIIEKFTLKYIYKNTQFFTVSNSTRKDLIALGVNKVEVIQNGVSLPKKLTVYPKSKKPTFVFLSALSKDKGVEDVIDVFRIISARIPESELIVMGKGETNYVEYLKSKSKKLNIKFLGWVDELTKFKYLSVSHILLFPSYHEGWGLVVIEANSVGTPAVVYPVRGLVDSVKDNYSGKISKEVSVKSMSEVVIDLLNSRDYESITNNCIKWASNFSWNDAQSRSFDLLRKIYEQ